MAEIHHFPKSPLPPRLTAAPISALAVALSQLFEVDSFASVAGAIIVQEKLKDLGFEVVRVLDLPPITEGAQGSPPVLRS